MSTRKKFTRNEMKAFLNILKDELEVEYNTRDITNMAGCKDALKEIVDIHVWNKCVELNKILRAKENYLSSRIDWLKKQNEELEDKIKKIENKKWWKFWE